MKRFYPLLLLLGFLTTTVSAQKARNTMQAIQFIKLANTLRSVHKSQESINLLMRALPVSHAKGLYLEATTNELIGLSYGDLDNNTSALAYLQKARAQYAQLKYVASAWAVNEVIRDISGKNIYAGIQIGASDIKVAIFKTQYESDFYEKDIKSTFSVPNVALVADASKGFRTAPDVLRACLDTIQHYKIPNERVFIVFGSDIKDELARTPETKERIYAQLSRALPNGSLRIDTTLTASREAELFTVGAIPRKVWPTTSALAIGATSTMGGYFDADRMTKNFHAVAVPVGINTLVSQIESKRSLNMDAFKREAQRVIKSVADTALSAQKVGNTGLQQRRTVGLGGDIAQAVVAYLHPEKADIAAVAITMEDVERFKRLALTDYQALTHPDLRDIGDPSVQNKADKDLVALQNQLNEKQLIVGTLWLEAVMKAYSTASAPKRFVFIRNSDISWVTGKFLETINYEYESTIAKGSLYTR